MISKSFPFNSCRRILQLKKIMCSGNSFNFSQALQQQFHKSRLLRQQNKEKLIYRQETSRLVQSSIDLKYLVPTNIFENQVTIEEYNKILVNDRKQNHFENSYVSINLNIAEDSRLRNTLIRYDQKSVRIGRLLQIMDMIAGLVSYRHSFGSFKKNNPFTLVTGSVQSLEFFEPINSEQDIQVQGFINNTGKTSMEIEVNINQGKKFKANSFFTMVCRNSADLSKGYEVPGLNFSHLSQQQIEKAETRKKLALEHINRRKKEISESFDVRPPNSEQISEVHELFLQRKNQKNEEQLHNQVKISSTYIETNGIMHLQDRNVHGKIFGGYLMREMLEIGWVAGKKFLKGGAFEVEGITDIYFLSAVEVGDGLTVSAAITYTQGNILIITIEAYTTSFKSGKKKLCCSCQLILESKTQAQKVYPSTYEEALNYLNSRRTFSKMFGNSEFNI